MTLRFSAKIIFDTKESRKNAAVFDSVNTDNKFYPENPTNTTISLKDSGVIIDVDSDHLPHLRANLNSILRLLQASYDSIQKTIP